MRITGGKNRGRLLSSPAGRTTRPTSDRAREAVFNILAHAGWGNGALLEEARVLDAFSGTGALALDALSRGAAHAVMIDHNVQSAALCKKNAAALKEEERTLVIRADATRPPPRPLYVEPRTLAFLDPPYGKDMGSTALAALAAEDWLSQGAICVLEMSKKSPEQIPDHFTLLDERSYGIALVRFLRWEG